MIMVWGAKGAMLTDVLGVLILMQPQQMPDMQIFFYIPKQHLKADVHQQRQRDIRADKHMYIHTQMPI